MSKIITQTMRCAVCGQESVQQVPLSRYVPDMGLDQKPIASKLSFALECPYCHYVAGNLSTTVTEQTKAYVLSQAYQDWAIHQETPALRRLEGAAKIAEQNQEPAAAASHWLTAAWYCEDNHLADRARIDREKAVQIIESTPALKLTPAQMLSYIDSLRQLKRFDRAAQVAQRVEQGFLQNLGSDHLLTKILQTELALLQKSDATPHLVSEVK